MSNVLKILCGVWTISLSAMAHAAAEYRFVTDRTVYDVVPGGTVPVRVYLQENAGSALLAEGGLFSAGVKISPLAPLPPGAPSVHNLSDVDSAPQFTGGALIDLSPLTLLVVDGLLDPPGPVGEFIGPGVRRIHIGTFLFTSDSATSAMFRVGDYDDHGLSSDTLTWEGTELDNLITPGEFSIRVVPEPRSPLVLFALGTPLAMRWRRAGRASVAKPRT